MISRYNARTVALEQICDYLQIQVESDGWCDDFIWNGETCNDQKDIALVIEEVEKIIKKLNTEAIKRPNKRPKKPKKS